ncbi:hypothetical protein DL770_004793 [Monosporascus sp. CRB-9-2]|nr:hypothetical protein DL770_004793 [Monosporascus sp. CRB-9-2]
MFTTTAAAYGRLIAVFTQSCEEAFFAILIGRAAPRGSSVGPLFLGLFQSELPFDMDKMDGRYYGFVLYESILDHQHEMALPSDTWKVDISPEIKIRVKTERILLDNDPSRPVDIMDIVVADKWMAPHWFEESTTLLRRRQKRSTRDERGEARGSLGSHTAGRIPQSRALTRALPERPAATPGESSWYAPTTTRASGRASTQSRRYERERERDWDEREREWDWDGI